MTALRFTDMGVQCDHPGCADTRYGSQFGLGANMTVSAVRAVLKRSGWKTGIENILYEDEREIDRGPRLDYCPEHAEDGS